MTACISHLNDLKGKKLFLLAARLYMGVWLGYAGAMKWIGGVGGFLGYLHSQFDPTWVPPALTTLLGWVILIAEPVIALWLLSGRRQRIAWCALADLFFLLTFGQTILQNYSIVSANWIYLVIALSAAAMCDCCREEKGECCTDRGEERE